jgi:hypothetical protein
VLFFKGYYQKDIQWYVADERKKLIFFSRIYKSNMTTNKSNIVINHKINSFYDPNAEAYVMEMLLGWNNNKRAEEVQPKPRKRVPRMFTFSTEHITISEAGGDLIPS